ncbi:hypothetical protein J5N97_007387 [Dioscorea zingiberensis]|uniref:Uncharacterized protein n=1 Tax=Dioscorea zingiberensis TaxID=325984 RepID=A0A9D5DBP3_9LILI|nr:hypothetical protein J5N97_007387 [Dioscorea zingiberensis]
MNTSPFMDIQGTGLSMPQGGGDILDFIKVKPLDKHQINGGGIMKDGVVSGYGFQPIHSFGFPTQMPPMKFSGLDGARSSSVSSDSKSASAVLKFSVRAIFNNLGS